MNANPTRIVKDPTAPFISFAAVIDFIVLIQLTRFNEVAPTSRVCIITAQATAIVAIHQCVAVLTNASTRAARGVSTIQTAIQATSAARRHFL